MTVWQIKDEAAEALAQFAKRGMQLSVTLQDESIMCADGELSMELQLTLLQPFAKSD